MAMPIYQGPIQEIMQLFPDIEKAELLFGQSAKPYGLLINDIAPYLLRESYAFEDNATYEAKISDPAFDVGYGSKVYWVEMLNRAHMASVSSIVRGCRWIEVAIREYESENIFGGAAACRSLLEASGDSFHSLSNAPITLAEYSAHIRQAQSGKASAFLVAESLEDELIHFTHARKIRKGDPVPSSHKALQSAQYIDYLEKMKIQGSAELYAHLCEIIHPAAFSASMFFSPSPTGWNTSLVTEKAILEADVIKYRETLGAVLMAAFNAPILTLRVLHAFNLFTKITPIKKYSPENIPAWKRIEKALRS